MPITVISVIKTDSMRYVTYSLHSSITFITQKSHKILCELLNCSHWYLYFTRILEEKPGQSSELTTSTHSWVSWEGEVVAEPMRALGALTPDPSSTRPYLWSRLPFLILGQHLLKESSVRTMTVWHLLFPTDPAGLHETAHINQAQNMWVFVETSNPFHSRLRS